MDHVQLKTRFKEYFDTIVPGIQWERLTLPAGTHTIAKGDYLFRQGDHARRLFFLQSGLVRYVNISDEGKEYTQAFITGPRIIGSTRSMVTGATVQFSIQALEDCRALSYPWPEFFQQMENDASFLKCYVQFLEQIFIREQALKKSLERDSAEKRYLDFCAENPEIIDKIPLLYVASYIGITPVALSRIRTRLKKRSARVVS